MSYDDEAGIGPLFYYAFSRATMSRIYSAVLRFLKRLLFALGCAIGTVRLAANHFVRRHLTMNKHRLRHLRVNCRAIREKERFPI